MNLRSRLLVAFSLAVAVLVLGGCPPKSQLQYATNEPLPTHDLAPVTVKNDCNRPAFVQFEEAPSGTPAESMTVPPDGKVTHRRGANGFIDIWLVDENGRGRGHVRASKQMDQVTVRSDCRGLEAD